AADPAAGERQAAGKGVVAIELMTGLSDDDLQCRHAPVMDGPKGLCAFEGFRSALQAVHVWNLAQ
ncbi:MAG: hypothetical protein ACKOBA_04790, partial [Limnohabitans sp.]